MELYHVMNRGVDGRSLFLDSQDYARFVHNLYVFNDVAPAPEFARRHSGPPELSPERTASTKRKKLVDIHGWCLMQDHYHLLLSERTEGGRARFLQKLNGGYAKYYNERYIRHGHLFQGRSKRVEVKRHDHVLYVLHYVHLNPFDYLRGAEKWRERDKRGVKSVSSALSYLRTYRWSSYLDYCGQKNFPSLLTKSFFGKLFIDYKKNVSHYLRDSEIEPEFWMLE